MMRIILALCGLLSAVLGDEIDNGVVGTPKIDCQEKHVDFRVKTQKPFVGRIYAEGFQGRSGCGVEAFAPMGNEVSLRLSTENCGMQRQRMTEPIRGMAFTVSLIVSFHGVFITKVDRAYVLQCYYEQEQAKVTGGIEVSAIPFTEITGVDKRKTCSYTVHRDSEDGPTTAYAAVGEALYHKWECQDKSKGIKVHSCKGSNGRGKEFSFYDERGCTIDGVIMPEIEYTADKKTAFVQSHAFKFSDVGTLNLECLVSLCSEADCAGEAPPDCGQRRQRRDSAPRPFPFHGPLLQGPLRPILLSPLPEGTYDTVARMKVIDVFDTEGRIADMDERMKATSLKGGDWACFQVLSWFFLIGLCFVLAVVATSTSCLLLRRRGAQRNGHL